MTQLTYFLLTRKLFNSPIWRDDPHILKLFIYLIGRAKFSNEPKRFQGFELKRGEIVTSLSEIADDNEYLVQGRYLKKWSRPRVSRMLTHLQKNGYIELLSDTYGTHISIKNYNQYQSPENYQRTPTLHQRNTSVTPAFIYNNGNNGKKVKKVKNKTYTSDFLSFWDSYPNKTGKKYCWKIWQKTNDRPPIDQLLKSIEAQKQSEKWKKDGGQYIPNPSTWLNRGQWEDEGEKVDTDWHY